MIQHKCCVQIFQSTALLVKGPSELHPVFSVSLIGVAISHEKLNGAVACVQNFVRHPLFTQRNFFLRDWDQHAEHCRYCRRSCSKKFQVWPLGSNWCRGWHRNCRSEVVPRENCITKEGGQRYNFHFVSLITEERRWWRTLVWCRNCYIISCWCLWWCGPRTTVRLSDVVEVGDVQCVQEPDKLGLFCCSLSMSSLGKSKKRRVPVSPGVAKKTVLCWKSAC